MKNIVKIFMALAIGLFCISCGSGKHTITGQVEGLEGMVYLRTYIANDHGEPRIDSTMVSDGKFVFKIKSKDPVFTPINGKGGFFVSVIADTPKITISGNVSAPVVTGSPLTDELNGAMSTSLIGAAPFERMPLGEERDACRDEWKRTLSDFVEKNHDNIAGALVLATNTNFYLTADETLDLIGQMTADMQESRFLKRPKETAERQKSREEGGRITDFTLPDPDGKEVALSEYTGKGDYVLIDFWASWCGPCLASIPALKEIYSQYHGHGFEVFAVSLDDDKASWMDAISRLELPWVQVSSLKGWDCPVAKMFGISSIPCTILIDRAGVIEKNNPSADEIAEALAAAYN